MPEVTAAQDAHAGTYSARAEYRVHPSVQMDNSELLLLLESEEALESKVAEAITVLKQHNAIPDSGSIHENGPVE